MTRLGDILRSARERSGASLDEIAASTKIRKHYLEALERNELEGLPGDVFVRGYLKTIAQFLDTDPDSLLGAYDRERRAAGVDEGDTAQEVLQQLARTRGVPTGRAAGRRIVVRVGAVVGAAILVGLAVWGGWVWRGGGDESRPAPVAAAPRPQRPAPPAAPVTVPPAEPEPRIEPQNPEREPEPEPEVVSPELRVSDFGVGTAVVDRQLVGRADRFPEGSAVWFWTRVLGGSRGDSIRHVWTHEGRVAGVTTLSIGGPHWRTQSRRDLPRGATGDWKVEALDASDRVLATSTFTCEPAD